MGYRWTGIRPFQNNLPLNTCKLSKVRMIACIYSGHSQIRRRLIPLLPISSSTQMPRSWTRSLPTNSNMWSQIVYILTNWPGHFTNINLRRLFTNLQITHLEAGTRVVASFGSVKAFDSIEWDLQYSIKKSS